MPHDTQPAEQTEVRDILREACERNVPVELHHRDRRDELSLARTRLLAMDDEQLFLDRPHIVGEAHIESTGQVLDAYLSLYGELYAFKTRVLQTACVIELNAQKRVSGMSVTRPESVKPGQRRAHFRVSLAAIDPVPMDLHMTGDIDPNVCPIDARRFEGTLVDLSLGGASIRVEGLSYTSFKLGDMFFAHFTISEFLDDTVMLCTVRHARPILDGAAVRLGVQFEPWPHERNYRLTLQSLQRFLAAMQRRQLRRSA
jgi:c-di-GMP-binding flagellar brake protein YcgR